MFLFSIFHKGVQLVEETRTSGTTDSRTLSPLFMGAKSGYGREPTDRINLGAKEGAGFNGILRERRWKCPGGVQKTKDETHK